MTTLVSTRGSRRAVAGHHLLIDRLREESDRQVAFSQVRLLLREAACAIDRLEDQLARAAADLEVERAARQAR